MEVKQMSTKPSTFYQVKGYPGLENMAPYIVEYFPKDIDIYVEPFAGLGRTAALIKANQMVLNDKSDYSVGYLKNRFPNAIVTQEDFREVLKKYNQPNVFFLIDPPWRKNIYKNNEKPFCDMTPIQYYDNVLHILKDDFKANWILCIDRAEQEIGGRVSKSGFTNLCLEHPTKKLYGRPMAVRMASNKPFMKTINNLTL